MEFFMTHRKIWKDLKALTYGKIKAKMGWHVETERWRTLNTMALVFRKKILVSHLHILCSLEKGRTNFRVGFFVCF